MKYFWLVLATFLGVAATAVPASADLQFTLNLGGGIAPTPGNYGTVTLHQLGAGTIANPYHVQVTVQLAAGERFAGTGAGYPIAWNITGNPNLQSVTVTSANAASFTVQNFSSGQNYKSSPFTGGSCNTPGDCFEYAIAYNFNGSNGTETGLVFDVKKSGGLVLTDFSSTINGYFFAADIFRDNKTGVVASNGPGVRVPEASTWTISIAGLIGLAGMAMLQRRRKDLAQSR